METLSRAEVDRYDVLLFSVECIVFGAILAVVGLSWGTQALEPAIVATDSGVMIVEGGARSGFLAGPFVAAIGVVLFSVGTDGIWGLWWRESQFDDIRPEDRDD